MGQKIFSITVCALLLFFFSGTSQVRAKGMDYELFQKFLHTFVQTEKKVSGFTVNVVDYAAIHRSRGNPGSLYRQILKMFSRFNLSTLKTKEEKVAFWINAYNIVAIKMIVDHYRPDLSKKVYRHHTLKGQLQEGAKRFLRDGKKGLKIDKQAGNSLVFSDIQV